MPAQSNTGRALSPTERAEMEAQRDMQERARRLHDYRRRVLANLWEQHANGEWGKAA